MSSGDPLQTYDSIEMSHDTGESFKTKMFSTIEQGLKMQNLHILWLNLYLLPGSQYFKNKHKKIKIICFLIGDYNILQRSS